MCFFRSCMKENAIFCCMEIEYSDILNSSSEEDLKFERKKGCIKTSFFTKPNIMKCHEILLRCIIDHIKLAFVV